MKIGKVNSRLSRFGSKLRGDVSKGVGRVSKTITQVERGLKKGVDMASKVADSKAVTGLQQATGIAGRLLQSTGTPLGQAAGGALLSAQQGIKDVRKALPSQSQQAKKKIGGFAGKARGGVVEVGQEATAATRRADELRENVLERKEPRNLMADLPNYVD